MTVNDRLGRVMATASIISIEILVSFPVPRVFPGHPKNPGSKTEKDVRKEGN